MVQTLTLLSLGVLNSQWTPPGSCLSTTTAWGNSYFLGYHKDAGHDPQCIPNVAAAPTVSVVTTNGLTPSTYTTTIAPSPTITAIAQLMPSADQNISSVGYYSPGICPSGFIYAASFTAGLPGAGKESRYICCPSGFLAEKGTSTRVRTTKGGRRTTRITTYEYPLCTQSARTITNLWSMTPGWPSVRPSSYNVSQTSTTNRNSKSVFSITASGIVVAWNPTDTPVVDYIRNNNIQLPPLPQPPRKKLPAGAIVGIAVGAVFVAILIAIISYVCRTRFTYRRLSKQDDSKEILTGTSTTYVGAVPTTPYPTVELSNLHPAGLAQSWQHPGGVPYEAPPQYDTAVVPQKP